MNRSLFELFNIIHPLSDEFWTELQNLIQEKKYPKRTLLLKEGDICQEIHFVVKGYARAYYFNKEEEVTSWFMKENDVIISVQSFFKQVPSFENIELLEESVIVSLPYDLLQRLYQKYPEFNFVGRVLTERYYLLSEERAFSLRMQTSFERHETLMSTHPEIFHRATLKHIASYLGMKPETLSRMRGKFK